MNMEIFVKDFTENAKSRILKFDTNIGNDKLYCVLENQPPPDYHSVYLSIFLFLIRKTSATYFSAPIRARVFIVCKHLKVDQVCWY